MIPRWPNTLAVLLFEGEQWVLIALLAAAVAWLAMRLLSIGRAVDSLRRSADRLAQGDLSERALISGSTEISALSRSLNKMAIQLGERLSTVMEQRNELEAVLTSMVEGVIALDTEERLISMNRAAATLLQVNPQQAINRTVHEVIRNSSLQTHISTTLEHNRAYQGEVTLRVGDQGQHVTERTVQFQSAVLRDARGQRIGVVLVLHDVTELRRLESMRRDFVANVSHEIKTPVAAIKAAVETLIDDPAMATEFRHRFEGMILRQADRLAALVEDLLSLARIEQAADARYAELQRQEVRPVLAAACETCQSAADEKQIRLRLHCPPGLEAPINATLIEQAVTNLVDNAIKYSDPDRAVEISVAVVPRRRTEGLSPELANVFTGDLTISEEFEWVIAVADEGRGIAPEHLPRLFERFYRTDKARSRDMGGTGLGLSIVKHIAESHGGDATVESFVGVGSRFCLHLPLTDRDIPLWRAAGSAPGPGEGPGAERNGSAAASSQADDGQPPNDRARLEAPSAEPSPLTPATDATHAQPPDDANRP